MDTPKFISNIDFTNLRTQKTALLDVIEFFGRVKFNAKTDENPRIIEGLDGILHLIDALQDYAVDELGIPEMSVFDFEAEENREKFSKPVVIRCERCNEKLNPDKAVWLELSITDGKYYPTTCFPKDHESQGEFSFGSACARTVITRDPTNEGRKID